MGQRRGRPRGLLRGVAVLAAAALFGGALLAATSGAAPDGLSKKEKKQGDKRWVKKADVTGEHFAFFLTGDATRVLFSGGGVHFQARCDIGQSPAGDAAYYEAVTTVTDAVFDSNGLEHAPFTPADSPAQFFQVTENDAPDIDVDHDGSTLVGQGVVLGLHDFAAGVNFPGHQDTCFFSGFASHTDV